MNKKSTDVDMEDDDIPEGFEPVRASLAGWFVCEKGNKLQGFLRGSFESKGGSFGPKKVYRIELTAPGTKLSDAGDVKPGAAGDIIGLDDKGFLRPLADIEEGREVFVRCKGKKGKGGQQDPWIFDIFAVPV
jgi:hypothetical protein